MAQEERAWPSFHLPAPAAWPPFVEAPWRPADPDLSLGGNPLGILSRRFQERHILRPPLSGTSSRRTRWINLQQWQLLVLRHCLGHTGCYSESFPEGICVKMDLIVAPWIGKHTKPRGTMDSEYRRFLLLPRRHGDLGSRPVFSAGEPDTSLRQRPSLKNPAL